MIYSDTSRFVRTEEFEEASEILEQRKCVVLAGSPGSGKTTLGHALLRKFAYKGFTPYVITHVHDLLLHVGAGGKSVVLLDGTLGEVRVDRQEHKQWRAALRSLQPLCKSGACLLVLTAYRHIVRELRDLDAGTDSPLCLPQVEVEVSLPRKALDDEVKRKMLVVHLQDVSVDPSSRETLIKDVLNNDASGAAFPWCCRQLVQNWTASPDPKAIFQAPAEAYVTMLRRMLIDPDHGRAFTAVLALTMQGRSHFLDDTLQCKPLLAHLGFGDLSDFKLSEYAHFLKGSILSAEGDEFFSCVLYDAAGLAFGRQHLLPILLKVCDFTFFLQYVQTSQTDNEFIVNIGKNGRDRLLLFRRFMLESQRRTRREVCQHPVIADENVRKEFLFVCVSLYLSLSVCFSPICRRNGCTGAQMSSRLAFLWWFFDYLYVCLILFTSLFIPPEEMRPVAIIVVLVLVGAYELFIRNAHEAFAVRHGCSSSRRFSLMPDSWSKAISKVKCKIYVAVMN